MSVGGSIVIGGKPISHKVYTIAFFKGVGIIRGKSINFASDPLMYDVVDLSVSNLGKFVLVSPLMSKRFLPPHTATLLA